MILVILSCLWTIICSVVGVIVLALIFYADHKYRQRKGS